MVSSLFLNTEMLNKHGYIYILVYKYNTYILCQFSIIVTKQLNGERLVLAHGLVVSAQGQLAPLLCA
jgi:hypothetical protein